MRRRHATSRDRHATSRDVVDVDGEEHDAYTEPEHRTEHRDGGGHAAGTRNAFFTEDEEELDERGGRLGGNDGVLHGEDGVRHGEDGVHRGEDSGEDGGEDGGVLRGEDGVHHGDDKPTSSTAGGVQNTRSTK